MRQVYVADSRQTASHPDLPIPVASEGHEALGGDGDQGHIIVFEQFAGVLRAPIRSIVVGADATGDGLEFLGADHCLPLNSHVRIWPIYGRHAQGHGRVAADVACFNRIASGDHKNASAIPEEPYGGLVRRTRRTQRDQTGGDGLGQQGVDFFWIEGCQSVALFEISRVSVAIVLTKCDIRA